jgi:predicted porin
MKLMALIDRDVATDRNETRGTIGAVIPFGQAEVHLDYDRSKLHNSGGPAGNFHNEVWQAKAGGVCNVSKRTALYTTVSYLENGNHSSMGVAVGSSVTAAPNSGGTSKGFELAVRHFF